ncbi:Repeat domain-containing protein [Halopseudomonas litoralis]|uniref:Repeat domain-containing protein n=1 Tax=Halopseudomonas litoralis TaxID=797277 RepID=A0A1H1QEE9_9GAMM|nr:SpvB/TcaC N-terminal domain-containing protein [Halopseudomonas litoralis]SDS21796.1 Repeat domain-containing protein [Halopseudomonas litoralis]
MTRKKEPLCGLVSVCALILFSVSSLAYAAALPGTSLTGELTVTPSGAASYHLPLLIPPSHFPPNLSLQYSSQAGNGPLGLGWSLGGFSQLSRCPRVKAIDGVDDGVLQFNNNDRLCLDGQRLILVSGIYGGNNAEYRTQIDSGLKIVGKGAFSSNTAAFEIRTQDGQVMQYGQTANSRRGITPAGTSTVIPTVWALSRVTDRFTNYYDINYLSDSGMLYPQTINYAGNTVSGKNSFRTITLDWAPSTPRPDIIPVYVGGGVSAQVRYRLAGVSNSVNSARYRISYTQSDASLSTISKIEYCPNGSLINCLNLENQYGHGKDPATGKRISDFTRVLANFGASQGWSSQSIHPRELADINGNGKLAIVGFASDGVYVSLPSVHGSSFYSPDKKLSDFGTSKGWRNNEEFPRLVVDVNGDGKDDIVGFSSTGVMVALANGSGFNSPTRWFSDFGTGSGWKHQDSHLRGLADVDGDGLPDIVGFSKSRVIVALNKRTRFESAPAFSTLTAFTGDAGWSSNDLTPRMLEDMNGDGKADIVGFDVNGAWVALSTGSSFDTPTKWSSEKWGRYRARGCGRIISWGSQTASPRMLADVNGDGLPDVIGFDSKFITRPNTGSDGPCDDFHVPRVFMGQRSESRPNHYGTFNISVFLNTGNSLVPISTGTQEIPPVALYPMSEPTDDDLVSALARESSRAFRGLHDYNGDGMADIVLQNRFSPSKVDFLGFQSGSLILLGSDTFNSSILDMNGVEFASNESGERYSVIGFSPDGVRAGRNLSENPGRILSFKTDLETSTISYSPLPQLLSYSRGTGSTFPIADIAGGISVVRSMVVPDGLGRSRSISYSYGELRTHFDYGSLGFRWVEEQSQIDKYDMWGQPASILKRSEFHQSFPLTGSLHRTQAQLCAPLGMDPNDPPPVECQVISQEVSDWSVTETGTTADRKVYRPHITKTTEHTWEPAL